MDAFAKIEIGNSYAISRTVADARVRVGLPSGAMQAASEADSSDSGNLFDVRVLQDGAEFPFESFCVPRVEHELTFIFKEPLQGSDIRLMNVIDVTEGDVASVKIIDARAAVEFT